MQNCPITDSDLQTFSSNLQRTELQLSQLIEQFQKLHQQLLADQQLKHMCTVCGNNQAYYYEDDGYIAADDMGTISGDQWNALNSMQLDVR